jgi:hypothetical protein
MKTTMTIASAAVAAFAFAAAADAAAYKLSPASTKFTASGSAAATLNGETLTGSGTFKGAVNAKGKGKITSAKFCGVGGCTIVGATGLPWTMKASSATTATIANVTFTSPGGDCGPANLVMTISGGAMTYNGPFDQCSNVTLNFTTTPAISIVR